jgi:hypothetical protein
MKRRGLFLLVVFLVFGFVLAAGGCGGGGDGGKEGELEYDEPTLDDDTPEALPTTSGLNGTWRIESGTHKSTYSEAVLSYKAADSTVEEFDIEVVEITEHSFGIPAEHYYYIDVMSDATPDNNPIGWVSFDWISSTGTVMSSGVFPGGPVTKEREDHYRSVETYGSSSRTETEYQLIDSDTLQYRSITSTSTEELLLKRVR